MINPVLVDEGSRLVVRCEASGNPTPEYKWYKDGAELKKSKEIRIKNGKKNSKVQIGSAKLEDSGNYTCVAENTLGKENGTSTVHVKSSKYKLLFKVVDQHGVQQRRRQDCVFTDGLPSFLVNAKYILLTMCRDER
ncbi:hypothetical protein PO909_008237 [Leuciscus waleckii]